MSTIEAFEISKAYEEVLPSDFFNQNFIDLTKLNRYAIVDTKNNLIVPREEKLKPFSGNQGKLQVLSFVSLAYEEMMKEMQEKIAAGKWEKDSIFETIKPVTAFESPLSVFNDFMTSQFQAISPTIYRNRKIENFETFLDVFQSYLASVKNNFDFTLAGFLESLNNLQFTGLRIEFAKAQKNSLELKAQYITDPAFKRYLLLAEKHGFYVNRHAPWSLVANIDSPAMQIYASWDAGINIGTEGILDRYFQPVVELSFDFFTKYLIGTYNAVAIDEPRYSYLVSVQDNCKGYEKILINRETVDDADIAVSDNRDMLEILYLQIRYYENFSSRKKLVQVFRKYRAEKKVSRFGFSDLVERLVGPAKNSSILFYGVTGATEVTSFEFPFEAEEFAAQLGSSGTHQMPNGRWMPCKTHEEYISLTTP